MSNVSDRHNVNVFEAGKSQALTGQRLAKVGYKLTEKMKKDGIKEVPKSICVSIPKIEQPIREDQLEKLMPHLIQILENAQDGIIRAIYENDRNVSSVSDAEISIEACIAFMEEVETGGRLTVEKLGEWFGSFLLSPLSEFLKIQGGKKLSGTELDKAVSQSIASYKGMITGLSGGKTHYDAKQREKLLVILGMVEDGGEEIGEKLCKRLEAMEKKDKKIAEDLGLIDFS